MSDVAPNPARIAAWPIDYDSLEYHTINNDACLRIAFRSGIFKSQIPCNNQSCNNGTMLPGPDRYKKFGSYGMCFECTKCKHQRAITAHSMLHNRKGNITLKFNSFNI